MNAGSVKRVSEEENRQEQEPTGISTLAILTFQLATLLSAVSRYRIDSAVVFEFRVGCQFFWLSSFLSPRVLGVELAWAYSR